jgi:hypothetical protein
MELEGFEKKDMTSRKMSPQNLVKTSVNDLFLAKIL